MSGSTEERVDLHGLHRWQQTARGERRADVLRAAPRHLLPSLRRLLDGDIEQELRGGRAALNPLLGFVSNCFDDPAFAAAFCLEGAEGLFGLEWYVRRLAEVSETSERASERTSERASERRLHATVGRLLAPLCALAQHQRGLLALLHETTPGFHETLLRHAYAPKAVFALQQCVEATPPGERQLALLRLIVRGHLRADLRRVLEETGETEKEEKRVDPLVYMRVQGLLEVFTTLLRCLHPGYARHNPDAFLRDVEVRGLLVFAIRACNRRADVLSLQRAVLDAVYGLFCALLSFNIFERSVSVLHNCWTVFEEAFEEAFEESSESVDGLSVLHALCNLAALVTFVRQALLLPHSAPTQQIRAWGYNTFIFDGDDGSTTGSTMTGSTPTVTCPIGPTAYAGIGGCLHRVDFPTIPAGWDAAAAERLLLDVSRFLRGLLASRPMAVAATEYLKAVAAPRRPVTVALHMTRLRNIAVTVSGVLLRAGQQKEARKLLESVIVDTSLPAELDGLSGIGLALEKRSPHAAHVACTLRRLRNVSDYDAYYALIRDVRIRGRETLWGNENEENDENDEESDDTNGEKGEEKGENAGNGEAASPTLLQLADAVFDASETLRRLGDVRRYR